MNGMYLTKDDVFNLPDVNDVNGVRSAYTSPADVKLAVTIRFSVGVSDETANRIYHDYHNRSKN